MDRNEPTNLSLVGGGETKTAQNNGTPTATPPLAIGVIFTFTDLPEDVVWFTLLQQYLSVREIARLGRLCSLFNDYWGNAFPAHRPIPVRVSTIEEFMRLAVVLTTKNMCTQSNPLVFELSAGVHAIGDSFAVPCSNLTLVGKGHEQTTICGMLVVKNQKMADIIPKLRHNGHCGFDFEREQYWLPAIRTCIQKCDHGSVPPAPIHTLLLCRPREVSIAESQPDADRPGSD